MLVVANHLPVAEGQEERFIELFEERVRRTRTRPGLESVEILQSVDSDEFVVQAYWESRAAFDEWRDSDDFRAAHADLPDGMFTGPNRLELYELAGAIGARR